MIAKYFSLCFVLLVSSWLLVACQSASVLVDRSVGHDFSAYQSFALYQADAGVLVSDPRINSLQLQRLQTASVRFLEQSGLVEASPSSSDFWLSLRLIHQEDTELVDFGADRFSRRHGLFEERRSMWLREVEYETVVVDVIDARTEQVVWRGESLRSLRGRSPLEQEAIVVELMTPLLAELKGPPAAQ